MPFTKGRKPRARFSLAVMAALVVAAAVAVPLALANTATPTTSHSTWAYVNGGSSGPVKVVVTGDWNWVTQSCAEKGSVSTTDVNGHYAIGFAGSWNDSTTPNTLTGKATDGTPVTLHVSNSMDRVNPNYCRSATASNPYPVGSFELSHIYPSLAAFQADVPNGYVCVNAYDIHQQSKTDDFNPGKNSDNTLKAGQYVLSAMCTTAQQVTTSGTQGVQKVKKVRQRAKPAKPVVKAASFTG
jgi:hypothetical protein